MKHIDEINFIIIDFLYLYIGIKNYGIANQSHLLAIQSRIMTIQNRLTTIASHLTAFRSRVTPSSSRETAAKNRGMTPTRHQNHTKATSEVSGIEPNLRPAARHKMLGP
jgi:hypothetical protein